MSDEFVNIVAAVARNPALLRLLVVLARSPEPPYTRQLLDQLASWGYGHEVLKKAEKLGLIRREEEVCRHIKYKKNDPPKSCKYVYLTGLGKTVLETLKLSYYYEALVEVGKHRITKKYEVVREEGDYIYVKHGDEIQRYRKDTWEYLLAMQQR